MCDLPGESSLLGVVSSFRGMCFANDRAAILTVSDWPLP